MDAIYEYKTPMYETVKTSKYYFIKFKHNTLCKFAKVFFIIIKP